MYTLDKNEFEKLVTDSINNIPQLYKENINNVAFFVEQEPSQQQLEKLNLRACDSLFGLYEGVPLTERSGGYALTLPDKITIFQKAHEVNAENYEQLKKQVYNTVWHEVAHYYGLNHARIAELEKK